MLLPAGASRLAPSRQNLLHQKQLQWEDGARARNLRLREPLGHPGPAAAGGQREAGAPSLRDGKIRTDHLVFGTVFLSCPHLSVWTGTILTKRHNHPEGLCRTGLLKFKVAAAAHSAAKLIELRRPLENVV